MERSINGVAAMCNGVAAMCSRWMNLPSLARMLLATAGESLAEPRQCLTCSIQNSASMKKCTHALAETALLDGPIQIKVRVLSAQDGSAEGRPVNSQPSHQIPRHVTFPSDHASSVSILHGRTELAYVRRDMWTIAAASPARRTGPESTSSAAPISAARRVRRRSGSSSVSSRASRMPARLRRPGRRVDWPGTVPGHWRQEVGRGRVAPAGARGASGSNTRVSNPTASRNTGTKNLAGRAGRLGYAERGESFFIATGALEGA